MPLPKFSSILMLLVAVLFMGTVQTVDASIDTDEPTITEVVSIDNPVDITHQQTVSQEISLLAAGPQFTAMEVCSIHQTYTGDKDHQVTSLYIPEKNTYGYLGNYVTRPRSHLSNSMYA